MAITSGKNAKAGCLLVVCAVVEVPVAAFCGVPDRSGGGGNIRPGEFAQQGKQGSLGGSIWVDRRYVTAIDEDVRILAENLSPLFDRFAVAGLQGFAVEDAVAQVEGVGRPVGDNVDGTEGSALGFDPRDRAASLTAQQSAESHLRGDAVPPLHTGGALQGQVFPIAQHGGQR
nr:hypothetical protein [Phormidium sp. CCY1219]